MSDRDVDAQFADIIAHWDDVAALPDRGPDAAQTNEPPVDGPPGPTSDPGQAAPPVRPFGVNPSPLRDSPSPLGDSIPVWRGATSGAAPGRTDGDAGARDRNDADDEDEHFHPGPTAPLPPQEDLHFWGIVVGLVAGPLLLLWLVIFRPDVSNWWVLASLGLTVMGFVLLVLRQPKSRDEDDPDDGARV
jgi:hypothetical protein